VRLPGCRPGTRRCTATVTSPLTPIIPTGSEPVSIGIGDFNGDGRNDIAVANSFGSGVTLFTKTTQR
jgi:hypothetical protein